jgi:hypothetical protein
MQCFCSSRVHSDVCGVVVVCVCVCVDNNKIIKIKINVVVCVCVQGEFDDGRPEQQGASITKSGKSVTSYV